MSSRRSLLLAALALACSPLLSQADSTQTAAQVVKSTPEFSTLARALEAAGLEAALGGTDEVTLFAPTDEAFARLPAGALDDLLKPENRDKLVALLKHHVVAGKLERDTMKKRRSLTALDGHAIAVRLERGNLVVGEARVGNRERVAANGRVFAIDSVLSH
ncbi:MAG: fasciclin domain-containing protein [Steroidobacteraceae bacterium]|nr:fasciclin domain-containing protein [Steroidobacteraceae bacterium]